MSQRRSLARVARVAAVVLALLVVTGAGARQLLTVSITSAPPETSTSADATFAFSADARDATFRCSLDGARATACSSPVTYRGLSLGGHSFVVQAFLGSMQASARYAWTIITPPPSPPRAWLNVVVEGAGTVVSAPPGLSCPTDCSEPFDAGTAVVLTAAPADGFELDRWAGACAGRGPCAVALSGHVLVKAHFLPVVKPADRPKVDDDKDGVPSLLDACPETAPRMRALASGCSLADLLRDHRLLLAGLDESRRKAARKIGGIRELTPVYRDLLRGIALIRKGAMRVERGDVCAGAASVRRGTRALRRTAARSAKLFAGLQAAIVRAPPGGGDADEKDVRWADLHYRQQLVENTAEEAVGVRKAFDAACGRMGRRSVLVGRIAKIDDADGLLRLASGRVLALSQRPYGKGLAEGTRARIVARAVKGGPALVKAAVGLDVAKPATIGGLPCVSLLFGPPQDWLKPNPILHPTLGYTADNVYWLEQGVRFAATPECPAGADARYSLRVVFTASGEPTKTITDLTSEDGPVPVPIPGGSKTWTITVTERRQKNSCPPPGTQPSPRRLPLSPAKSFPCPVVDIRTTEYAAKVLPPGAYATALYDRTILAVNQSGLDTTKVFAVPKHTTTFGASFEADGYGTAGTDPPFAFKTVHLNELFGVRPDNWYSVVMSDNPDWLLYHIGADHFAGLVWPRIVGTRHGSPFRYRAKLPTLVNDLLPGCPGETCFFRLPWIAGGVEKTTQGNNQPVSHYGAQAYAFDFKHDDGETIYATRGGVVGDLVESLSANCVPPADCPSNYLRIDHQDGTYSWYAHVQTYSVVPVVGQKVTRGQAIALIGNVGRSQGPHLHYQVSIDKSNTIYGQTIPICFETIWFNVETGDPVIDRCYVPVTGYFLQSTNG